MEEPKRGREEGKVVAKYFGTEYQANPGSSRMEYYDSIAWYYGHEKWSEMKDDERQEAAKLFEAGVRKEQKAQAQDEDDE